MDQMTYRVSDGFVWPTVGHPGMVPLDALVPTPNQPRIYFNKIELIALAETMKVKNRGSQREIVSVRELTEEEKNSGDFPPSARFMIKSGERRWRAAKLAGLSMLEIRVKEYDSEEEEDVDTFMLNEGRVGLSYYENARWLGQKVEKYGWKTQAEIAKRLGKDIPWVSDHLAFSKLHPAVQEQMHPEVREADQYKRPVAVFFARFDRDVQLDLHNHLPPGCKTVSQQINWIRQHLTEKGVTIPTRMRDPRKHREKLLSYAGRVEREASTFLTDEDFRRLFHFTTPRQVEYIIGRMESAAGELNRLIRCVREIADKTHSQKSAPVATQSEAKKTEPTPVLPASQKTPSKPTPVTPPQAVAKPVYTVSKGDDRRQSAPAPPSRPVSVQVPSGTKPKPVMPGPSGTKSPDTLSRSSFTYYDDEVLRYVTTPLTHSRYKEYWERGIFKFQRERESQPDFMPHPNERVW